MKTAEAMGMPFVSSMNDVAHLTEFDVGEYDGSTYSGQWRFHAGARGHRPPKSRGPPNLAVLLTHCGQLILRKISKFDAIRCQILRLKCTKFDFRPRPTGELTALPQIP